MKIAITGSNGFVGKNLIPFFESQHIETVSVQVRSENVERISLSAMEADALVHLAGIAHDLKGEHAEAAYQKSNTDLSIALINQFLDSNIGDFIYLSSVKAIADTTSEVLKEATAITSTTAYGISKLKVEQYIQKLAIPEGKRIFVLQPTLMYGAGSKGNLHVLYNFVRRKLPYPFAAFQNKRSFLNVKNLGFVMVQILKKKELKSDKFLVADDQTYSTNQLIQAIAAALKVNSSTLKLPQSLIRFFAKIGDVLRLPVNSSMLSKLTGNFEVDNSKIKNALGISSLPFELQDGIKDMIDNVPKNQ